MSSLITTCLIMIYSADTTATSSYIFFFIKEQLVLFNLYIDTVSVVEHLQNTLAPAKTYIISATV